MDVKRPSWTPPGIAFPFIWLTITALRATAAQMAYAGSLRNPALDALVLHFCIGDTWNCITNVERRLGVSAVGCFAVWGSVFRAVKAFGCVGGAQGRVRPRAVFRLDLGGVRAHGVDLEPQRPTAGLPGRGRRRQRGPAPEATCSRWRRRAVRGGK